MSILFNQDRFNHCFLEMKTFHLYGGLPTSVINTISLPFWLYCLQLRSDYLTLH